jgi:putative transposase
MPFDPFKHHRHSIRLRGYDYSSDGAYSVTICTRNRECTLGGVVDGEMVLSEMGRNVEQCWLAIPNDLPHVGLDEYQIMPNHLHGIVVLWRKDDSVGDLIAGKDSVRDLINQIPPGNFDFPGYHIAPGDPLPPDYQIIPGRRIPLGVVNVEFSDDVDWPLMKNPKQTLGKVIRHFKATAATIIHKAGFCDFEWQRGYHDHIIRDERDLERVRRYIRNNPLRWWQNNGNEIERA